ncbi:hypothetical protein IQ255_20510 [Pleurocapsales cyanobacterium LEGE 10410]|nr:hypothetical protein [Pleurocapsales cyanobacterium LEGE 10410]
MFNLFKLNIIYIFALTMTMLLFNLKSSMANTKKGNATKIILAQANQTIQGRSGGSTDSHGCGFVANRPNYEMNLEQEIDYMRLTVQAAGGQPTLLVLGPNSEDSFCVLGDEVSGLKPEISGVWEAGYYRIYVGDRIGERHQFTLSISTDN